MAIMSGLNSAPACRLKQTNDSISKKARKVYIPLSSLIPSLSRHLCHLYYFSSQKVKNAMLDLVSPDRSYRSLRETTQNYDLPVLPYVYVLSSFYLLSPCFFLSLCLILPLRFRSRGMTMTDLTFIEEGQGHRLPGIPIHKYQLISNVLNDIGMYQRVSLSVLPSPSLPSTLFLTTLVGPFCF